MSAADVIPAAYALVILTLQLAALWAIGQERL